MADNDHLQRQIEFIVNNQAQFTTDIQQLKDLHKQAEQRMTKLEDVCLRLGNALVWAGWPCSGRPGWCSGRPPWPSRPPSWTSGTAGRRPPDRTPS